MAAAQASPLFCPSMREAKLFYGSLMPTSALKSSGEYDEHSEVTYTSISMGMGGSQRVKISACYALSSAVADAFVSGMASVVILISSSECGAWPVVLYREDCASCLRVQSKRFTLQVVCAYSPSASLPQNATAFSNWWLGITRSYPRWRMIYLHYSIQFLWPKPPAFRTLVPRR